MALNMLHGVKGDERRGETGRRNRDVAHREDFLAEQPRVIHSANQGVSVYTQDLFGGDHTAEWSDEKI